MKIDPETYDWSREKEVFTKKEALEIAEEGLQAMDFTICAQFNIILVPKQASFDWDVYYINHFCGTLILT